MIWFRRLSWAVMWAGLVTAVFQRQDVLAGVNDLFVRIFTAASIAVALGLLGLYLTLRSEDDGFGF